MKKTGTVLRAVLEPLELTVQRRMLLKMKNVMNTEHPFAQHSDSSTECFIQRLLKICCNTDDCRRSFLSITVIICNYSLKELKH